MTPWRRRRRTTTSGRRRHPRGRAFCAGAYLSGGGFGGGEPPDLRERWPWQVRKPVIAAVNGHAIGVGITYAMQCDVRYVADDAKPAFAFVIEKRAPKWAGRPSTDLQQ